MLLKVELGKVGLESLGAEAVATWVSHFGVPVEQAEQALAKALWLESSGNRAAASATGGEAVKESVFFRSVIDRLRQKTDT